MRREVELFSELMEDRLRKNDHKPGWKEDKAVDLLTSLEDELRELRLAIKYELPLSVGRECADVANFAMMIADVVGALDAERGYWFT